MQQENTAKITLLISLVIHGAILSALPFFKNIPQKKELTNLEVTYRHIAQKVSRQERSGISKELLSIKQKELPKSSLPQDRPKVEQPPKFDLSELFKPKETILVPKPQPLPQGQKIKKISLKNLPLEQSKEPAYLSYRDVIRKKIQDKVYYYSDQYFYFDNPHEGKIFVSFTVSSDGILKELDILENKSSDDNILRKIVTTAIKNSAPFDKFPKDLKYDERTFNLEISFEIE